MEWGAHTFGFVWHSDADDALRAIGQAGFRHVQLMATPPHFDPWTQDADRTRRLRSVLDHFGMDLVALDLASSDINLASPSHDVVSFSLDAYRRAIDRCRELGARSICVGSGRRHGLLPRANERLMETFRTAFAQIVDTAEREGVQVILENHPQGLLADAAAIASFLDGEGYRDMPVIYDVANAFAAGENPADGIVSLGARIAVVHLSDTPRGKWHHDPISTGAIDFHTIAAALRQISFEGKLVLETMSDDTLNDLVLGREYLIALGLR
jgi:sugar phosphate isomerase/epimerase